MRRKITLVLPLGLLLLLFVCSQLFAATYTFDSDNQGWQRHGIIKTNYSGTSTNDSSTSGDHETVSPISGAAWYNDSGNGCLRVTAHYFNPPPSDGYSSETQYKPRPYDTAVVNGFGDLTGQRLQADFKRDGNDFSSLAGSPPTIRWFISDTSDVATGTGTWYVSKVAVSPTLNSLTGSWQTLGIDLDPNNFFLWPYGDTSPSHLSFEQVLQQNNYIGITLLSSAADNSAFGYDSTTYSNLWTLPDYGASSSGDLSYLYIDNVTAAPVPIPGALWLLGSGLLGFFGIHRRQG